MNHLDKAISDLNDAKDESKILSIADVVAERLAKVHRESGQDMAVNAWQEFQNENPDMMKFESRAIISKFHDLISK